MEAVVLIQILSIDRIMMFYSEKIKSRAIDGFDDFIIQVVLPNDDELKGIQQHNRSGDDTFPSGNRLKFGFRLICSRIVHELRESVFSMYNLFLALAAELMEKFLICNNCSSLIGFSHQPLCLTESLSEPNVWKKLKFDDKFITFGMKFCFDDLVAPGCRKNIKSRIISSCLRQWRHQVHARNDSQGLRFTHSAWPHRWTRGKLSKAPVATKINIMKRARSVPHNLNPPLSRPSIWTPQTDESPVFKQNSQLASFTFKYDGIN
jgi:hypothetical protein